LNPVVTLTKSMHAQKLRRKVLEDLSKALIACPWDFVGLC